MVLRKLLIRLEPEGMATDIVATETNIPLITFFFPKDMKRQTGITLVKGVITTFLLLDAVIVAFVLVNENVPLGE